MTFKARALSHEGVIRSEENVGVHTCPSQEARKPLFHGYGEMLFLASKHFLGLTLSVVLASRDL